MRKLIAPVILFSVSLALLAQDVPRAPVVNSHPKPSPTPAPLPSPVGLYSGGVHGTLTANGTTGSYLLGTWTFTVVPLSCRDCDPGQYDISSINGGYKGMTYSSGAQEQGYIFGVVNPSGHVVGFNLLATNCSTINPSGGKVSNPGAAPTGYYFGGFAGEIPGPTITFGPVDLSGGFGPIAYSVVGRISGRDCFNQIIMADVVLPRP